ncbi:hypothetical protein Pelo_7284 [Pelomyxa schiedti]|nr:hypothetical protein Pelo_7284 [Pelomyxa schiedti]
MGSHEEDPTPLTCVQVSGKHHTTASDKARKRKKRTRARKAAYESGDGTGIFAPCNGSRDVRVGGTDIKVPLASLPPAARDVCHEQKYRLARLSREAKSTGASTQLFENGGDYNPDVDDHDEDDDEEEEDEEAADDTGGCAKPKKGGSAHLPTRLTIADSVSVSVPKPFNCAEKVAQAQSLCELISSLPNDAESSLRVELCAQAKSLANQLRSAIETCSALSEQEMQDLLLQLQCLNSVLES